MKQGTPREVAKGRVVYDIPRQLPPDARFYITDDEGRFWNRLRRRWDPAFLHDDNRPYSKFGHAKRGATIAAATVDGNVTVTTTLEEKHEDLPRP